MADFRKWLFALALVALLVGAGTTASAQNLPNQGVSCTSLTGNPVIVRSEGITELVGDLVFQCTGGTPTTSGALVPTTNVTLTLNTNITSRLLGSNFVDALLLIDEPWPAAPFPPSQGKPNNSPAQVVCQSNGLPTGTSCNSLYGQYTGSGNNYGYGGAFSPYVRPTSGPEGAPAPATVYVAQQSQISTSISGNQVTWLGVPIDAPGTNGAVRYLRITNVRANACQLGLSSTLIPTQIVAFISVNGSQNITFVTQQFTVAYIQQGLIVSNTPGTASQCNSTNTGLIAGGNSDGTATGFSVTVREGFAASFKPVLYTAPTTTITAPVSLTSPSANPQNVPGFAYNSESALNPDNASVQYGLATHGTRIQVAFTNVGTGVHVFAPLYVKLTGGTLSNSTGLGSYTGGFLQLVGGTSGGTVITGPTGFQNAMDVTGTIPVYEVVNADPAAVETAVIGFAVAYVHNGQASPAAGAFTTHTSFNPLSTVNTWSSSAPIPRFCDQSTDLAAFTINLCQCQLLFPFVTQAPGFDTGIAIANTSQDTYNNVTPQSGTISLYFYGQLTGGAAVPTNLAVMNGTTALPAGQVATYTTFSGGGNFGAGWQAMPGFTGYVIAVANFQWCHGFAFISDLGAQKLAEGYLALQLDNGGLQRTTNVSEVKSH